MDHPLDELRQRQRKLIYYFGEQIYGLCKSAKIDLAFSSKNSAQEKEISKLFKLLHYMEERIQKFEALGAREVKAPVAVRPAAEAVRAPAVEKTEDVAGQSAEEEIPSAEEEADAISEPAVESASETAEETSGVLSEPAAETPCEIAKETSEAIPEPFFEAEETPEAAVSEEAPSGEASPVASYDEIWNQPVDALSEPVVSETSDVKEEAESEVETLAEQRGSETLETGYQPVEEAPEQEVPSATITFQDIRESAQFKSETEKSLFEDNLDMLLIGDATARTRALKNLSYLGGKEAFQNVCRLSMKDPSAEIRMAALKAAGRTRQPENAELYRAGLRDQDGSVRIASNKGLSMLLLNDSTTSLLPLLRDPDAHVRSIAATCLGIYGGTKGVQAASELWSDQDAYVRKSLVDMLAVVRAPGSLAVVKQLLDDQDEGVRQAAKNALSKVKSVDTKGK